MLRLVVCACILALSHWCSVVAESNSQLVVHTPSGDIRGRIEPAVYGLSVRQFRGIPFAEPPIGKLRFAKPQPAQPWTGVRDATEFGPICTQINKTEIAKMLHFNESSEDSTFSISPQSEDCLTLNVYTPEHAKPGDNKTVMVWVHGGGFIMGSGSHYDPSVIVSLHDVIVVTINYRLGVFGFFNIPGTEIKGNYGMHDQALALQWVQQHISSFGGNPDSVTIFGESAGAMSVSLHLLSPLSKGLFHRVIAQSGSSATLIGRKVESGQQLDMFSNATGCPRDDAMVECLWSKSEGELYEAQAKTGYPYLGGAGIAEIILPVFDGDFLPDEPRNLLKDGRVNKADVITGVNVNEGVLYSMFLPNMSRDGVSRKVFQHSVRHGLSLTRNPTKLTEDAIIHAYTDHRDPENSLKVRQQFVDLMTDVVFAAPAVYEASCLADHGVATYFYVFEILPDFFRGSAKWMGSMHGLDLPYSFGNPLHPGHTISMFKSFVSRWSAREVGFSMNIMKMWTDFAKYGDPNHSGNQPVAWPRYNSTAQPHLVIALEPRVGYKFHADKVAFWNEFLPKLEDVEPKREQQKDTSTASKDEL